MANLKHLNLLGSANQPTSSNEEKSPGGRSQTSPIAINENDTHQISEESKRSSISKRPKAKDKSRSPLKEPSISETEEEDDKQERRKMLDGGSPTSMNMNSEKGSSR